MGLLGEVQAAQEAGPRPGLPCIVKKIRAGLEGEDLEEFEIALSDDGIKATILSEVLRRRGFRVARGALNNHRRRVCGCYRE